MMSRPWSVDRWGRLLAGCGVLGFALLALLHHPAWACGALALAANLVITSLTDRCPLHDLLIRLGAREREDLYYPGGAPRSACDRAEPQSHLAGTRTSA